MPRSVSCSIPQPIAYEIELITPISSAPRCNPGAVIPLVALALSSALGVVDQPAIPVRLGRALPLLVPRLGPLAPGRLTTRPASRALAWLDSLLRRSIARPAVADHSPPPGSQPGMAFGRLGAGAGGARP